jgi:BirA family biotin operon repressor/biotin-[acetyl-CoA-carboxylase] ligase
MAMKDRILDFLRGGGFVSGEDLSVRLKVSRTAVWKNINSLREQGYEIDSVTNRGYRLVSCPDVLTPGEISPGLNTRLLGTKVYCFDSVDSTNEEAKRQALAGAPDGSVFVSERQTGGKGRLGRGWNSPPGTGLWFSVLLRPGSVPARVSATTLLAGYAVRSAIRESTDCPAMIKWPNDIVIGPRKVCGILTEMSAEMERVEFVVVGIGVNVNNAQFPEGLKEKATSLFLQCGKTVRRTALLGEILRRFEKLLEENRDGLSSAFLAEYKKSCVSLNRTVSFERNGFAASGTAVDISPEGELVVAMPDGTLTTVYSGEVSVQGFYGK